jgi:hypothetical protein
MMKALTFPVFRNNGVAVQLREVLAVIPENDLVWSILEFNGMGEAPNSLSMDEFEELIRKKPTGFMMSWGELTKLSGGFYQTIDCIVVGAKAERDILNARMAGDNFSSCEVVLSAFDSTEWSVWTYDTELMKRFVTVFVDR